jgi:phospholipid/cholesterol/gamma-HCH transport system permease protein
MALLSPRDRVKVGVRRIARRTYRRPLDTLDDLGDQLGFYGRALAWTPRTLKRYKRETFRLLAEVTFGTGALAVIGGTVGVIAFLSFFTGTEVGLQGYAALDQLGTSAFTGFLSAYFNTREIAPLVAGLALSATVGCGFTAQIGAMRINEEIDALEVMGVPSLPFLVTTRIIAGFIAVIRCTCWDCSPATSPRGRSPPRRSGSRPAPTTTTSTSSCHRRTCCGPSSRCSSSPW